MYYIIDADGQICGESVDAFNIQLPLKLVLKTEYQPDPQVILSNSKKRKLREAAEAAQVFIEQAAGLDAVPQFERESWAVQGQEAQAWAANPQAPTPILAGIAQARGVPLDVLRQKALAKSQAFTLLTASVAGQRQAIEDKINAAGDMQALDAVVIAYQIPGAS